MSWGREEDARGARALTCEGEYWTFSVGPRSVRLRHSKGIIYLAHLLEHPGVEIDALALSGGVPVGSDLGPALDDQAKRAYRGRLTDLQDELAEAEGFGDEERAARARAEFDAIVDQLSAATGLGGRDRRTGSAAERARLNVTRAIRSVIERIAQTDPALAGHLGASVRTGRVCTYRPADDSLVWSVKTDPPTGTHPAADPVGLPETRYARSGEISIAYQTVGEGSVDLVVIPGFLSHLDLQWSGRAYGRFLNGLAGFSRLILFDKRGVGLSDPVGAAPTLEERMDDVRAVMDAVDSRQAVVFGMSEGTPLACLFAATFPSRTLGLVLYGAFAAGPAVGGVPGGGGLGEALGQAYMAASAGWGEGRTLAIFAPSVAGSERRRQAWGAFERASMSPAMARALIEWEQNIDVRAALPAISAPTLVLHRVGDRATPIEGGRYVAELITGSRFVELPGDDHAPITGDIETMLDVVKSFVGDLERAEPRRTLATVLVAEGPEGAGSSVAAHLSAAGGRVIARSDQIIALFDTPGRTIRIVLDLLARGSVQRAGLHVGECELGATVLDGVAVAIAVQAAESADSGQLVATQTVRDLVLGSGIGFNLKTERPLNSVGADPAVYSVE